MRGSRKKLQCTAYAFHFVGNVSASGWVLVALAKAEVDEVDDLILFGLADKNVLWF
jgi:hypothetical protein